MAGGTFTQADVLCPFYLSDTQAPSNIKCEGLNESNRLFLNFPHKRDKMFYMRRYCTKEYKDCCLYKTIYEKYE